MIAGFYTYIHCRADDGLVFYVGKGKGKRLCSRDGRSAHWHHIVKKHGLLMKIVATWGSEEEAFEHEKALIAHFREIAHPLCNRTNGGDGRAGYRLTEEAKRKISIANTGRKHTAEQIRRNSEFRLGKPLRPETCEKMSASNMGHEVSEETRAKIRAGHIGKTNSAKARAKISAANKGRIRSEEFKAKIVAALTGRPCSTETREKISAAQRGRVVSQEMRERISRSLTGRRLSDAEKARLYPLTHSAEIRAKRSAAMAERPWSEARRAAQEKRGQSF